MKLNEQVQAWHVVISHLDVAVDLSNLWLSHISVIPQVGQSPRLIFDFRWSGHNESTKRLSPMEVMRFRSALHCILQHFLTYDTLLGPVYIREVELAVAYMRLWVEMEDVLSVAFLVPKKTPSNPHIIVFHLSLPIGYVESTPYLCMSTNTVAGFANKAISRRDNSGKHNLEESVDARAADVADAPEAQSDASWEKLLAKQRSFTTANVDIYLDVFISVIQGGGQVEAPDDTVPIPEDQQVVPPQWGDVHCP